jgi:hypothetical protein
MRLAISVHAACCYAVLFLIPFPGLIEAAEISSEVVMLQKAAGQAVQEKQFDSAGKTYESIIRRNPAADAAMDARGKLVSVYLQAGQRAQADAAAETLMMQASNSAAFKQALHEAARAYRWKAKDSARARQLYSRWMDKIRCRSGDADGGGQDLAGGKEYRAGQCGAGDVQAGLQRPGACFL